MEDKVCSELITHSAVCDKVPGISRKVFICTELYRVYEVTYDNFVIFFDGSFYQTCVTFMEISHCGNESYGVS